MHPQQNYSAPSDPSDYDFIVNPQAPQKRPLNIGSSTTTRALIALGGLVVLLIIFSIVKSLLVQPPQNVAAMTKVLTQQQELIAITKGATVDQKPLSSANQTIAITTELSLTTAQSDLLTYLRSTNQKINSKKLVYQGASAIDAELAASITAGTYDPTFNKVLRTQLTDYEQSLKTAFDKTKGARGRELLSKQYDGAVLLLKQVPAN